MIRWFEDRCTRLLFTMLTKIFECPTAKMNHGAINLSKNNCSINCNHHRVHGCGIGDFHREKSLQFKASPWQYFTSKSLNAKNNHSELNIHKLGYSDDLYIAFECNNKLDY